MTEGLGLDYNKYIKSKNICFNGSGIKISDNKLNDSLIDFQKAIVAWSLRKGRACLFEDCGLGKTIQQLDWAQKILEHENKPILILAPLAVSKQTKTEGEKFGIEVNICESQSDVKNTINITNYEKLHKFDASKFIGMVSDESSILKSYSGKIRNQIISLFKNTKYKLSCTATPSPNDYMELGNQSEFMGIMTRSEMLSKYFTHDSGDTSKWRLRGYAEDKFWQWLCSWAVYITKPSDLGFKNDGFILPPLKYNWHSIKETNNYRHGTLFPVPAETLSERRQIRKESIYDRVKMAKEIIEKSNGSQSLLWCDLNAESNMLKKAVNAVEIKGSDTPEHKEKSIMGFAQGKIKRLVTKPSIAGFGINWQSCHNMVFVGLSDSYEAFYQATRRCWRFGQKNPVDVNIVYHELEGNVIDNIKRKEKQAKRMAKNMLSHMKDISKDEIIGTHKDDNAYIPIEKMEIPRWL
jgi:hypothetical protein